MSSICRQTSNPRPEKSDCLACARIGPSDPPLIVTSPLRCFCSRLVRNTNQNDPSAVEEHSADQTLARNSSCAPTLVGAGDSRLAEAR